MVTATTASAQVACPQANSPGAPAVNNQSIFCGDVSGQPNRAKGFHSRPGGLNPNSVSSIGAPIAIPSAPTGIYRLQNFNITQNGVTRVKAISVMFPDACSQAAVLAAIRNAAAGASPNQQFHGMSGPACQAGNPPAPFNVIGYTNTAGGIIAAWPDY
jgi:hypothetical protein